ncbi:MAG TPA: family 20 glycosylhydrolase [Terracidiphilus sp.]
MRTHSAFRSSVRSAFRSSGMLCLAGLVLLPAALRGQDAARLPLMPLPSHLTGGAGEFLVNGGFSVVAEGYADPRVAQGRERFLNKLWRETGIPFQTSAAESGATLVIKTGGPSQQVQQLGEDESYHLAVTATHVELTAPNALGVLHGLQTFLQLVHITAQGFAVPVVTIDDEPRFPWRGLMIDVGRHFMPLQVIKRNLDGMEAVKLNVFHWHLSDDQGFRIESKQFPLLQEKGSNGHYYTQEQVREVIEYARMRGIRVVPEFDMPCHATSWFAGYPQLASGSGPYQPITKWGIFDPAMDPTRESTFEFLDKFFAEMTALFPDLYFHIGGDECDGKEWDANPRVKQFMREHDIKDNAALQSYFSGRVEKLVAGHNKIMEGWDEVLQPDTPPDVVVQSWRGPKALAAAARQGNRVLLSNGYYIDLNQPASEHYLVDPLSGDGAKLDAEQRARVLGGEAAMWSEFVTPENIDSRIWPRTAAIAERFWSPQDVRDVDSMYRRMALVSEKLNDDGLEHNSFTLAMLQRMSGNANPEALEVLAAVVEPPKGYAREELKQYTVFSPLNELVDAVAPESETARKFNQLATLVVQGKATAEQWQEAETWLELWRDNDARLAPSLKDSDLTLELAPLSRSLSEAASVGLKALDDLKLHRTMSAEVRERNLELLKAAGKPKAVLLDKIVPSVELLVKASGN